jgi:hypothetical protein
MTKAGRLEKALINESLTRAPAHRIYDDSNPAGAAAHDPLPIIRCR